MNNKEYILKYKNIIEIITNNIKAELSLNNDYIDENKMRMLVENQIFESKYVDELEYSSLTTIVDAIYYRVASKYSILNEYLNDPNVNEIMVNGYKHIFIEREKKLLEVDNAFYSNKELEGLIRMFAADVHREVNESNPIVDARLDNGYRVNGVLKNVALNGPILTIRKFSNSEISLDNLIEYGSITSDCAEFLKKLVKARYNIFISGGTSSGKTTFLNALASSIEQDERVIIIEDSSELRINHILNKVHMECRSANSIGKGLVSMEMLIKTSLRMRPDRIIVGEVRGREVIDMIQAMSTGHDGSMSTGHGNSIKGMLNRLETMYLMDTQIPIYSIKNQISNAVDIFIHLHRTAEGKRKVVEVAEMVSFDGTEYKLNYLYSTCKGLLEKTTNKLINNEKLIQAGINDEL